MTSPRCLSEGGNDLKQLSNAMMSTHCGAFSSSQGLDTCCQVTVHHTIPGALRTRNLTPSTSQLLNLSISQLSSLPLTSERARQKFLGVGGVPRPNLKFHLCRFFHFYTHQSAPSTFLLLCPNASKNAGIARYCRRSCKRDLVQVVATRFLTPLMERLFYDWDQLFHFCRKSRKWGVPPPPQRISRKSKKSIKCKGKWTSAGLSRLQKASKSLPAGWG